MSFNQSGLHTNAQEHGQPIRSIYKQNWLLYRAAAAFRGDISWVAGHLFVLLAYLAAKLADLLLLPRNCFSLPAIKNSNL
jgi:hypothetical protein